MTQHSEKRHFLRRQDQRTDRTNPSKRQKPCHFALHPLSHLFLSFSFFRDVQHLNLKNDSTPSCVGSGPPAFHPTHHIPNRRQPRQCQKLLPILQNPTPLTTFPNHQQHRPWQKLLPVLHSLSAPRIFHLRSGLRQNVWLQLNLPYKLQSLMWPSLMWNPQPKPMDRS